MPRSMGGLAGMAGKVHNQLLAGVHIAASAEALALGLREVADGLDDDAVVIALKSRTTPVAEAVEESLAALDWTPPVTESAWPSCSSSAISRRTVMCEQASISIYWGTLIT